MTSPEISDIPLGDSFNSDLDEASFTELPKKRPRKRAVKTGVSLFLPADFLNDDRLVAAVKTINITPVDFNNYWLRKFILSHTYIRKHFNKITKAVSSTIRKK